MAPDAVAAPAPDLRQRLRASAWLAIPLFAGLVVWLPSLRGTFVWDDWVYFQRWIVGNQTLHAIFFPDSSVMEVPYYKPMAAGTSYLLYVLTGKHPLPWRAFGLALHLLTIAGIAVLGARLLPGSPTRRAAGAAGATLFAVWPAHAEAIGWVSARSDLLIACFMTWGVWLHLRSRDRGSRPFLAALCFFVALLSKEVAVAFVPIVVLMSLFAPPAEDARVRGYRASASFELWLPYVLAWVVYSFLRHRALGASKTIGTLAGGLVKASSLKPQFFAWGFYVRESLLLGHGAPYLEYIRGGTFPAVCAAGGILVLALAASCVFVPRWRGWMLAGAWFAACIAPAVAVAGSPSTITPVAMRYLYAPSVGIGLAFALFADRIGLTSRWRRPAWAAACGAAIIAFGALDQVRLAPWMNDTALWIRALQDEPNSVLPRLNLGNEEFFRNHFDAAENLYRTAAYVATPVGPDQKVDAFTSLARYYVLRRRYDMARVALLEAMKYRGAKEGTATNLTTASVLEILAARDSGESHVLLSRDKLRQQIALLEEAASLDRFDATSRMVLGMVYESVDEPVRARHYLQEFLAVSTAPESARKSTEERIVRLSKVIENETDPLKQAYYRAEELEYQGDLAGARDAYRRANELAPDRVELLSPLADLEANGGNPARAEELMAHATELAPSNAALWFNLGIYRARNRKMLPAAEAFEEAARLAPTWPKPWVNAARALEIAGDRPGAIAHYRAFLDRYQGPRYVADSIEDHIRDLEGPKTSVPGEATKIVAPP